MDGRFQMQARRWDEAKREYGLYDLPEGSSAYESDMETIVACARCGRPVTFGECYTSMQIHTPMGFGYAVCQECHEKEWAERKESDPHLHQEK